MHAFGDAYQMRKSNAAMTNKYHAALIAQALIAALPVKQEDPIYLPPKAIPGTRAYRNAEKRKRKKQKKKK